jgi:hypothetical protein
MSRTASREFWKSTVKPAKEQQVLLHPEAAKRIDDWLCGADSRDDFDEPLFHLCQQP